MIETKNIIDSKSIKDNIQNEKVVVKAETSYLTSDEGFEKRTENSFKLKKYLNDFEISNIFQSVSENFDEMIILESENDYLMNVSKILQKKNEILSDGLKTLKFKSNSLLEELKLLVKKHDSILEDLKPLEIENNLNIVESSMLNSKFETENALLKNSEMGNLDYNNESSNIKNIYSQMDNITKNITDLELINIVLKNKLEACEINLNILSNKSKMSKSENDFISVDLYK